MLDDGSFTGAPDCLHTSLAFVMQYVDDAGGASVDDELYTIEGQPVWGCWSAREELYVPCDQDADGARHLRRADAHYRIAVRTIERFGHSPADGKGVPPTTQLDLLGVHVDVVGDRRMLSDLKCKTYSAAVQAALDAPVLAAGGRRTPYAEFNSLVHKLLHASSVVVLGRQHVHHCMPVLRATV